jgi:hypothetical protein
MEDKKQQGGIIEYLRNNVSKITLGDLPKTFEEAKAALARAIDGPPKPPKMPKRVPKITRG